MAAVNTDEDSVEDVLQKLKSGRRPAATVINQAESLYTKLKKELQLYKDEIIEIKKAKNSEVANEEHVQEQPNGIEIYKMMEASARHASENEQLKEHLKSAKLENEHLSQQIDDLKQQIDHLTADLCKEQRSYDIMTGSDDKPDEINSKMNDSRDGLNTLSMQDKEMKLFNKDTSLRVNGENVKEKIGEVLFETTNSKDKGNGSKDISNESHDNVEVTQITTNVLSDEKNEASSKGNDLHEKEGVDTHDWEKILQDKEKELQEMKNSLKDLKEEINKYNEANTRLEFKVTNLSQDLKLQQKITIDKERQIQTIEDDLHNLTDENSKLKSENTRFKTEIDSLSHLRKKELEQKENGKDVHTVAVFGRSILEENRKLKSENEHLKGELKYANEKVHRLSKQLDEQAGKRENSKQDEDLNTEINELRMENMHLRHDVKKLSLKVQNAKYGREKHKDYGERPQSNDQLPRRDSVNKNDLKELQEENRILKHEVKQLKQNVEYAKYDRDQQRKQEEISHTKALKYKEENNFLKQEKGKLIEQKTSLEHELHKANDKLKLILGERNKDKDRESRRSMNYGENGYNMNKEYGFPGAHNMKLESELKATKDQLQRLQEERRRDKKHASSYKEDYYSLKKDFDRLEHDNIRLERELKIVQSNLQNVHEQRDRLKSSPAKSIEEEYSEHLGKERMYRTKRGYESESRSTRHSTRKLSGSSYDTRENDNERQRVEDFRRVIEKQKDQIKMLSHENKTLQNDVHEVRNRLSVLAGHKLTKDNPNIADLSDDYRPTNIAEQFREVYDNEWTHAYEELDVKFQNDETKIIDTLLSILKNVEAFCIKASSHQFLALKTAIENELTYPKYKLENGTVMAGKHRAEMSSSQKDKEENILKDLRKSLGILSTGPLAQIFHEIYMTKELGIGAASVGLKTFVVQSVKLVWMMQMQTPPMGFIWADVKQNVDRDRFTFYTKRGDIIKQCVWPAVELHKNGPLMSKGIVQAM